MLMGFINLNIDAKDLMKWLNKFIRALPHFPQWIKSLWDEWWRWPRIRPIIKIINISPLHQTIEDKRITIFWVDARLFMENRDCYHCDVNLSSTKLAVQQGKGRGRRFLTLNAEASEEVSRPVKLEPRGTERDSCSVNIKFGVHYHGPPNEISRTTPDPCIQHPFLIYNWTALCKGFTVYKKLPPQGDKKFKPI